MKVDTLIKNGLIVQPHGILDAGIGIEGEKIVVIAGDSNLPQADRVIDVKGKFVLPGCIDVFAGTKDPGGWEQEDWKTCSEAAAVGGVTMILDKSGPNPPTSNLEGLRAKVKSAEASPL